MPLAFDLSSIGLTSLVTGDLELTDPFNPTITKDLLRFIPGNKLLIYSDLPAYAAADVGVPVFRQSNLVSLPSAFGISSYGPTFNVQTGAQTFSFFGNFAIYNYVSSVPPIPEPSGVGLLSSLGWTIVRRTRRNGRQVINSSLVCILPVKSSASDPDLFPRRFR